jgi:hypothetical protein
MPVTLTSSANSSTVLPVADAAPRRTVSQTTVLLRPVSDQPGRRCRICAPSPATTRPEADRYSRGAMLSMVANVIGA